MSFPTNPSNGMIFEALPGLTYIYNKATNCWVETTGATISLASCLNNGNMSSNDLRKLDDLIIPPIETTIKSEDCNAAFTSGSVRLFSSDDIINVTGILELHSSGSIQSEPWEITDKIAGFDFTVDLDSLVSRLRTAGNYTEIQIKGPTGPKGEEGDAGQDRLDTGPQGEDGDDGLNAIFPGSLITESLSFEIDNANKNKAIVDLKAEITGNSAKLVATRANIGNPQACPTKVLASDIESPWILVLDRRPDIRISRRSVGRAGDCTLTCEICSSSIRYFDISSIVTALYDRFRLLVSEMKLSKEQLVSDWLRSMVTMFTEHKSALCCALENCKSRTRNQDVRRYIESSRIQALQAQHSVILDGQDNRVTLEMDPDECPVEEKEGVITGDDPCVDCQLIIQIDGVAHAGDERNALTSSLPDGEYIAEVTDCCIARKQPSASRVEVNQVIEGGQIVNKVTTIPGIPGQFTGRISFRYNPASSQTGTRDITIPDLGTFPTNSEASAIYGGYTFGFSHRGGEVRAYFPDAFPQNNSGLVEICIKPLSCFDPGTGTGTDPENFVSFEDFFSAPDSCSMIFSQVAWYERGWQIGACCGAYVDVSGSRFLVVKRSIGTDTTCGGGESLNTECISSFINSGAGHPAIAYPSSDGFEFDGKPTSGSVTLVADDVLSNQILNIIRAGGALEEKGDPANNIDLIIFPSIIP